ncbi:hypothetical protein [Ornithinimicrobium murale]|uniref:hypothetical protein n=1 Tax=Ornithinimicrobium murale TaxID=1050153 RepID=UPI0013B3E68E|nr:hypothetical protein [Ornithinimicrobium murale]
MTTRETRGVLRTAIISLALVAGACSSGAADPDVSHEGQVAYACALAHDVAEGDPDIANWTVVGNEADDVVRQTVAMSSLAGGGAGFVLADRPELSDAGHAYFQGVMQADVAAMEGALADFTAACDGVTGEGDVSQEGQISYACALADHLEQEHGVVESWGSLGEDHGWHESASIAAFLGAANGQLLSAHADLSTAGKDLMDGVSRLDMDLVQSSLDQINQSCEQE